MQQCLCFFNRQFIVHITFFCAFWSISQTRETKERLKTNELSPYIRVCPKHQNNWSIDTVSASAGLLFAQRAPLSHRTAVLQSRCSVGLGGLVIKMHRLSNTVSQLSSDSFELLLPPDSEVELPPRKQRIS